MLVCNISLIKTQDNFDGPWWTISACCAVTVDRTCERVGGVFPLLITSTRHKYCIHMFVLYHVIEEFAWISFAISLLTFNPVLIKKSRSSSNWIGSKGLVSRFLTLILWDLKVYDPEFCGYGDRISSFSDFDLVVCMVNINPYNANLLWSKRKPKLNGRLNHGKAQSEYYFNSIKEFHFYPRSVYSDLTPHEVTYFPLVTYLFIIIQWELRIQIYWPITDNERDKVSSLQIFALRYLFRGCRGLKLVTDIRLQEFYAALY